MTRVYDHSNPADEARFRAELTALSRAIVELQLTVQRRMAAHTQKEDAHPQPARTGKAS